MNKYDSNLVEVSNQREEFREYLWEGWEQTQEASVFPRIPSDHQQLHETWCSFLVIIL